MTHLPDASAPAFTARYRPDVMRSRGARSTRVQCRPIDWRSASLEQRGVDRTKRAGAGEPTRTQRAGVGGGQHRMPILSYQSRLPLGVRSPKREHHRFRPSVQHLDRGVSELLPSTAGMRTGLPGPNRQHRVEQQHPLLSPTSEISAGRRRHPEVVSKLLEDVAQRRWRWHARRHTETQPVRLPGAVIGILTKDQHSGSSQRTQLKRPQQIRQRWIDSVVDVLSGQERLQISEHLLIKLGTHRLPPVLRQASQQVHPRHAGRHCRVSESNHSR